MLPVEPPLQLMFVVELVLILNVLLGSVIVTLTLLVQPLMSLMPMLYMPALKLENVLLDPYVPPPML
jgi:hypothetical protein